jgi:translocation and assembly module TamB
LLAGTDAEKIRMQLQANGTRLGRWSAKLDTQIRKLGDKWTYTSDAPLQGELHASVPELQWLVSQFSSDFSLKGALSADATFAGSFDNPLYKANIEGKGLEFAFASEGLLFPNGELKAELNEKTLKLTHLRFSNKVAFVPKQEQFQDLNWTGKQGEFNATGEVNWHTQAGAIKADWEMFPLLQRKDRWLLVTGQANITQVDNVWALVGKLKADAAYFKLPKMPPPSLSGDVLVSRGLKLEDEDSDKDAGKKALRFKLDLQIDMGPRFLFVGRGLNTALSGALRLRGTESSPIHASGSITTNGGQYEGYGQQLEIERGILNFQGAPGNPSLNIRALRKGLAVEAGVDVTGTVANPVVRLVSEPNVPDSDKISWLVLGREADQVGSADASLLLSAAGAIFGGDGSRNIPKELVQGLGFDEFSIGPSENGGASKLPSQTVAGATDVGASSNDKVVRIGWRMRPGLVLAVERGVSDASAALKLSWQLTRRIRMIGSFGTDNSLDMKYKCSFN